MIFDPNTIQVGDGVADLALDVRANLTAVDARLTSLAPATSRLPGPADDLPAGFATTDLWRAPNRRVYEAKRTPAGNAVWTPRASTPLLAGDIVPGAIGLYGALKLKASATACFSVTRASDSTSLSIGFIGNRPDWAAYDAFISGTTVSGFTWSDQSGAGNHATSVTTAIPGVTPFEAVGSLRGTFHDHVVSTNGGAKIKRAFTIPTSLTAAANALSVVALTTFGHGIRNSPIMELSPTGANTRPVAFGHRRQNGVDALTVFAPTSTGTQGTRFLSGYKPPLTPIVTGFTTGLAVTIWGGDRASATTGNVNSGTLAGGLIGGSTLFLDSGADPDYGYNIQGAVLIFGATITAAQYALIEEALYLAADVSPQRRGRIVVDGTSIDEGAGSTYFESWPRRMIPLLSGSPEVYNVAIMGGTFASQTSALVQWSSIYASTAPYNYLIVGTLGTNDLAASSTAAETYTALQAYLAIVRAAGWRVILGTIPPRTNLTGSKETERQAYNTLLRANYRVLGCVGVIDFAADVTFGAPGANLDTTLYSDGTHPTDLGYAYMAQIAANWVNANLFGV